MFTIGVSEFVISVVIIQGLLELLLVGLSVGSGFWVLVASDKNNLLYHMSIFHLDENGFPPCPFPQSFLVSTHITKVEELYLGVGEDETDDWRERNMIPDMDNLQANDKESGSQFEASPSQLE